MIFIYFRTVQSMITHGFECVLNADKEKTCDISSITSHTLRDINGNGAVKVQLHSYTFMEC